MNSIHELANHLRGTMSELKTGQMTTTQLIRHARSLGITITLCRDCKLPTLRPRYCSDKCSNRARQKDHYKRTA